MRKHQILKAVFAAIVITAALSVNSRAVNFNFQSPRAPKAPKIVIPRMSDFDCPGPTLTVYADIQGETQTEVCCNGVCEHECAPNCDFSACAATDFTFSPDPRIIVNPPCVPGSNDSSLGEYPSICGGKSINPIVSYYNNGYWSNRYDYSTDMIFDYMKEKFKQTLDLTYIDFENTMAYYFTAADSMGNVVAQVPDPSKAPCETATYWNDDYDTLPMDNCAAMNSYEECGNINSGPPACGNDYTLNDPVGDTCDNTGSVSSIGKADIIGMTAGYGKGYRELPDDNVVCARVGLAEAPPSLFDIGSPTSTVYSLMFNNPDISDSDPDDFYMPGYIAAIYIPEAISEEPGYNESLWDGECATNPNTTDPASCKLIGGSSFEPRIKITASGNDLVFIAKDELPNGKKILGSMSRSVGMTMTTGQLNIGAGTPMWIADTTADMTLEAKNQDFYVTDFFGCPTPLASPTNVVASPATTRLNYGVSITYTNSSDYSGQRDGHNIYICNSNSPNSCFKKLNDSPETKNHSTIPYTIESLTEGNSIPHGFYYFAVSYQRTEQGWDGDYNRESALVFSNNKVQVGPLPDPCDMLDPPARCSMVINLGKITERKIVACQTATDAECVNNKYKIVEGGVGKNARLIVVDNATGETVRSTLLPDGTLPAAIKADPFNSQWFDDWRKFKILVHIPADTYGGLYGICENSATAAAEGCDILISENASFSSNSPMTTAAISIPKVRAVSGDAEPVIVGGGGDVGDVTGDGKIGIADIVKIKDAFGTNSTSQCYRAWADANLDGSITVKDLMIVKARYGKSVPKAAGEVVSPTLIESSAPLPACCKTGACR